MPPRKSATAAPTRRSARLASRESSVASETSLGDTVIKRAPRKGRAVPLAEISNISATVNRIVRLGERKCILKLTLAQCQAVITDLAEQYKQQHKRIDALEGDLSEARQQLDAATTDALAVARARPSIRRDFTMKLLLEKEELRCAEERRLLAKEADREIEAKLERLRREQTERETALLAVGSPFTPRQPTAASSPETGKETEAAVATSGGKAAPPALPRVGWRRLFNYVSSPFSVGQKRAASDDDGQDSGRSQKRTKVAIEPAHVVARGVVTPQQSSREALGPSVKNPKVPTSLSTITEQTERSNASLFSSMLGDGSPSKGQFRLDVPQSTPVARAPPASQSARDAYHPAAQNTPAVLPSAVRSTPANLTPAVQSTPAISLPAAQSTPFVPSLGAQDMPATSLRRRTAKARLARLAENGRPRPREPNADKRMEKMERVRRLQKELEELQKDQDIIEMQSHRRKRVKVDDLAYIPHNQPGDPTGTFRVPEIDSDDEMEVDESVVERQNVFDQEKTVRHLPPALPRPKSQPTSPILKTAATPKTNPTTAPIFKITAAPKTSPTTGANLKTAAAPKPSPPTGPTLKNAVPPKTSPMPKATGTATFVFPDVGTYRPNQARASKEFRAAAAKIFEQGFQQFLMQQS